MPEAGLQVPEPTLPPPPSAGREDYDKLAHFGGMKPGEPYFLIVGHDAVSGPAVRAWAALAFAAGVDVAQVEAALQQADRLDAFQPKKLPDADHLALEERKQLAYAFSRRAWNARTDCADSRLMLAEERAIKAALMRAQPLIAHVLDGPADGLAEAISGLRHLDTVLRAWRAASADLGDVVRLIVQKALQAVHDDRPYANVVDELTAEAVAGLAHLPFVREPAQ